MVPAQCKISSTKYSENAQNGHMLAIRAHTVFHFYVCSLHEVNDDAI